MKTKKVTKGIWVLSLAMSLWIFPAKSALAQFKPESGAIDGYMINEYYSILQHNDPEIDGRHGFWFRRIYFTYNNKLSDTIKMRFRLETASPGQLGTSALLTPFVKDAYLSFKLGQSELVAGIQGPPSFEQLEGVWGWRPLEKTPLDLQRWTSSRDFGLSLKGGKEFVYHFMFANGSSNKAEVDKGKKVFGSYSGGWGRVGVQYSYRRHKVTNQGALPYNIVSAFGVFNVGKTVELIARYDWSFGDGYKKKFSGGKIEFIPFADNHEFGFLIGALSWQVVKNVWVMPNVKYTAYKENDLLIDEDGYSKPKNDVYGNLTLYFKF